MSECCAGREQAAALCPICGVKGKPVSTLTVKSLVRDHKRVAADASYWLCRVPTCDVVYFSLAVTFHKSDLKVRVGFKEQEDPIPLCYCFDYSRADISREMGLRGETDIPKKVKAEIQRGFCACEVKNPSGACCLGDIGQAIQQIKSHHAESVPRSIAEEQQS